MSMPIKFRVSVIGKGPYLYEAVIDGRWHWRPAGELRWKKSAWETSVAPNTVREQWIGLRDKHRNEIYVGDIVVFKEGDYQFPFEIGMGWSDDGEYGVTLTSLNKQTEGTVGLLREVDQIGERGVVIGNIHRKPRVLR